MKQNNKILWIDDEIDLLESHIIYLSEKGYSIVTCNSGEDAIVYCSDNKVDLILLDEMMTGIDGIETLKRLKDIMQTNCIKHTSIVNDTIERVAVCGGSGSFLLNNAKEVGADIFITADFKYHEFFDAENDIVIADIGHYESEQFTKDLIYDLLVKKFTKFAVLLSKVNTNPINYL